MVEQAIFELNKGNDGGALVPVLVAGGSASGLYGDTAGGNERWFSSW